MITQNLQIGTAFEKLNVQMPVSSVDTSVVVAEQKEQFLNILTATSEAQKLINQIGFGNLNNEAYGAQIGFGAINSKLCGAGTGSGAINNGIYGTQIGFGEVTNKTCGIKTGFGEINNETSGASASLAEFNSGMASGIGTGITTGLAGFCNMANGSSLTI